MKARRVVKSFALSIVISICVAQACNIVLLVAPNSINLCAIIWKIMILSKLPRQFLPTRPQKALATLSSRLVSIQANSMLCRRLHSSLNNFWWLVVCRATIKLLHVSAMRILVPIVSMAISISSTSKCPSWMTAKKFARPWSHYLSSSLLNLLVRNLLRQKFAASHMSNRWKNMVSISRIFVMVWSSSTSLRIWKTRSSVSLLKLSVLRQFA